MTHNPVCSLSILKRISWMLVLMFTFVTAAVSQQNPNAGPNKESPLNELLKLQGKLVAEAAVTRGTSNANIRGYRIEELQLPRSINVELRGQQFSADRAWRITLTGGPFPVRALPAVVWIDDQIAGFGIENETLSQITAITFDGSLIREGALISLSYGEDKDARLRPAQPLRLKREGGNQ